MSYTIEDIDRFVQGGKGGGDHEYDNLLSALKKAGEEGVWMPMIGWAKSVEYSDDDHSGQNYFVFSIKNWDGIRYFRKTGRFSSFGGAWYDGGLEEVKEVPVQRKEWQSI